MCLCGWLSRTFKIKSIIFPGPKTPSVRNLLKYQCIRNWWVTLIKQDCVYYKTAIATTLAGVRGFSSEISLAAHPVRRYSLKRTPSKWCTGTCHCFSFRFVNAVNVKRRLIIIVSTLNNIIIFIFYYLKSVRDDDIRIINYLHTYRTSIQWNLVVNINRSYCTYGIKIISCFSPV